MPGLPTFEEIRRGALLLLGDAEDELRADWHPTKPAGEQNHARREAMEHIALAKAALDRAAA